MTDACNDFFCLVNLDPNGPKIFGFSEFLAGLALMVLAWTIADTRYRFRIKTAPIPLEKITFWVVFIVGCFTILTDLWRANGLPVIKGNLISPAGWQALLAASFFITFLGWVWFAFIKPSQYGKLTSKRYIATVYQCILRGSKTELAIIADELARSSKRLIFYATDFKSEVSEEHLSNLPDVEAFANDMLSLISDKRFCKAVIESSQNLALTLFIEVEKSSKFGVDLGIFSKNILTEAIKYEDSFLYHESDFYESGFLGSYRPLSRAMFGNPMMVEKLEATFDVGWDFEKTWTTKELKAYVRAFLVFVKGYINDGVPRHSFVMNRTLGSIAQKSNELHMVNGVPNSWDSEPVQKLGVVVSFFKEIVNELNRKEKAYNYILRIKDINPYPHHSIYDTVAKNMYEVIHNASYVNNPWWDCWSIHHNTILKSFFGFYETPGVASKIVQHKLRREIYDEIKRMETFPNFQGARVLGFCLFAMGFKASRERSGKSVYALHKALLNWVRINFKVLHERNSKVSSACLFTTITYDVETNSLVRVYEARGLSDKDQYEYFVLDD
ncbi:TPA: hypothetical protein SLP45_002977 [Klebsiella oxytoca]|nr:hypothetical protein [Klebsiella oxytoca]HEJ0352000.1 hypothetical protein [Klebsiella oxytoca]